MMNLFLRKLDVVVRVLADFLTIMACISLGLLAQIFIAQPDMSRMPANVFLRLLAGCLVVVPIGIVIFYMMGLYTYTRGYPLVRKGIRVLQAVTLVFLIGGPLGYLVAGRPLPRTAFLLAWALTLGATLIGRIWARIWAFLVLREIPRTMAHSSANSRNVLLIGGAGYIGSALLPLLLERGFTVRLLDTFVYGEEPIRPWLGHRKLEVMRADFRQVDKVVEAMQGIGTVIHLGAIVGDPACALNEELTIEVNLMATRMIAEVAKGEGVSRFIFASTCSVYGINEKVLNESSQLNPISLYARSKIACEQVLLAMKEESFKPVLLRFGTIYGLSGRTRFDLVVNVLAAKALVDGEMTVYGSDQFRPFVHVEDGARAVLAAVEINNADLRESVFNVGSDEQNLTLGDVGRLILNKVPSAKLKFVEDNVDIRNYRVSFGRIREQLGFLPFWSISEGVDQVLDAIRSGAVTDYKNSKYSNVSYLKAHASDILKVQNGWAKHLLENGWVPESLVDEAAVSSAD